MNRRRPTREETMKTKTEETAIPGGEFEIERGDAGPSDDAMLRVEVAARIFVVLATQREYRGHQPEVPAARAFALADGFLTVKNAPEPEESAEERPDDEPA